MGLQLDVCQLIVRKSGYTLLKDVTFSVAPNQFVAILGANGAGKTTLLRAMTGERPYSGRVCLNGQNLYDDAEKWFQQIGYVPIDNVLHERLPVIKALTYAGKLRHIPSQDLQKRIKGLLAEFGLTHKSDSPIYQLSSGERKKANICAELLTNPGLLLLDEPTTNLDPHVERKLMEMLAHRAKDQRTTIVIISHTINSLDFCDEAIFMGNSEIEGRLQKDGDHWIWSSPFATDRKEWISRPDFYQKVVQKLNEHQTKPRYPSHNPPKNSVPCGHLGTSFQVPAKKVKGTTPALSRSDIRTAWAHYWTVLARQIELFYYEGWRIPVREIWDKAKVFLLRSVNRAQGKSVAEQSRNWLDWNWMIPRPIAITLGWLSGFLLVTVLPDEALVQSSISIATDASDASQGAFLIGLVAFLLGLFGSFRQIVREIHIYEHERRKGLMTKPYLLAKFTVFATFYGLLAPTILFVALGGSQLFPINGLVLGSGAADIWLLLVLTSLAGVALGFAISSIGSKGELATVLMGATVIANALLSGLVKNETWEELIDRLSILVPSRWALEGLYTTTQVYCWGFQRVLDDHYSTAHLYIVILALTIYVLCALMVAYLALHRKDIWFKPHKRFKLLIVQGNYLYSVIILIMIVATLLLRTWTMQAHESNQSYAASRELGGISGIASRISAAQCEEQEAPSTLDEESAAVPESQEPLDRAPLMPTAELEPTVTPPPYPTPTALLSARDAPLALTATLAPTNTPNPKLASPVPQDLTVVIPNAATLYYAPTTQQAKLASLPTNSTLTLLSQAAPNGASWLRVQVSDKGHHYVGWISAAGLTEHLWKTDLERKAPPDCAKPVASTYQKMEAVDIAAGRLGTWVSDGKGEIAVVVDLYRDQVGTLSDSLTLHFVLNGQVERRVLIEAQHKRFLLQNGVYNVKVDSTDRLELVLTSEGSTLNALRGHVSIFLVPDDCEFRNR